MLPGFLCLLEEWGNKLSDSLCLRRVDITLLDERVGVVHAFQHVAVRHLRLPVGKGAVAKLLEIARHVTVSVGVTGIGEAVLGSNGIIPVGIILHVADSLGFQCPES